jgi:hypothetical protein
LGGGWWWLAPVAFAASPPRDLAPMADDLSCCCGMPACRWTERAEADDTVGDVEHLA